MSIGIAFLFFKVTFNTFFSHFSGSFFFTSVRREKIFFFFFFFVGGGGGGGGGFTKIWQSFSEALCANILAFLS
jgi:hypothetical protein